MNPHSNKTETLQEARFSAYAGDFVHATNKIAMVRRESPIEVEPRVAADVIFTEGVVEAAAGRWASADDRLSRSRVVANMFGLHELAAHSAIWQAHCRFNRGDVLSSLELVSAAAPEFREGGLEFAHRFSSVIAQVFAFCGNRAGVETWSSFAKSVSSTLQSRALFSATIYNTCALRVWQSVLIPRVREELLLDVVRSDLLYLESTINYDQMVGAVQRPFLQRLMMVQLLGALGEFERATSALASIDTDDSSMDDVERARALLEKSWLQVRLPSANQLSDASLAEREFDSARRVLTDFDDLAFLELVCRDHLAYKGDHAGAAVCDLRRHVFLREFDIKRNAVRERLECMAFPEPWII